MLDQVMETELAPLSLLEKAARVLGAFEGPQPRLSLTEVVRRSKIPRSSAHRILDQLVQLRWLDREGRDYRMGMRMLELGALASHHNRLRRAALPLLHALHEQTGRVVHLSVLDGAEVVCLERIGGSEATTVPSRVGGRMPAYCTATGKAILAFSDPSAVEHVLAQGLRPRTARTLVRPLALRSELAAIRESGVAYDREESFRGISCVAAPLRGPGGPWPPCRCPRAAGTGSRRGWHRRYWPARGRCGGSCTGPAGRAGPHGWPRRRTRLRPSPRRRWTT